MKRIEFLLGIAIAAAVSLAGKPRGVEVLADWQQGIPAEWESQIFDGETRYTAKSDGSNAFVQADAEDSASCIYRKVRIDVNRTPFLRWSWRVDVLPILADSERSRAGDDYAARLYIVREGWLGKWTTQAIDYVWSSREPVGTRWPNAFAPTAIMWSVDQGRAQLGEWIEHTRNVRDDWKIAFDEDLDRLDGIAIMTDADNSNSRACARFGSIRFCETADCGEGADQGGDGNRKHEGRASD